MEWVDNLVASVTDSSNAKVYTLLDQGIYGDFTNLSDAKHYTHTPAHTHTNRCMHTIKGHVTMLSLPSLKLLLIQVVWLTQYHPEVLLITHATVLITIYI